MLEPIRDTAALQAHGLRRKLQTPREIRRAIGATNAAAAIGPVTAGLEVFALTAGSFSLIDAIQYCLDCAGPADVTVATWTIGAAEIEHAWRLLNDGRIRHLRFIVDGSLAARQPAYCALLRKKFGDHAIRATKNHSKFVLIVNETWNLVIRSSMNLNENKRLEAVEVSDDRELASYIGEVVDGLFAQESGKVSIEKRPGRHAKDFDRFVASQAGTEPVVTAPGVDPDARFFGDGPFVTDVRRRGWSYAKGA